MYIFPRTYTIFILMTVIFTDTVRSCIQLLNSQWKPVSLQLRTEKADVVVTAKILYTSPIPGQLVFYSATFEIMSVLKGLDIIQMLHKKQSRSILTLDPKIVASAKGFGDSRLCFSSVEVGESYALFLGYNANSGELVAKYDDLFGAADLLYKRTERDILLTLGWKEWSGWEKCSKTCGTGSQVRKRECSSSSKGTCHGPSKETRECNTYSCKGAHDLLTFITNYENDFVPAWGRSGEIYTNGVDQKSPSSAPTYLLFNENFPREPVFRVTFKGPIEKPQYVFSIYDANSDMILGIKVTQDSVVIAYTVALTSRNRQSKSKIIAKDFKDSSWYDLSLLVTAEEFKVRINCENVEHIAIKNNIFENMDIFGRMYLGAGSKEGNERFVRAEMTQICVIDGPATFWHQCGKTIFRDETTTIVSEGSGNEVDYLGGPQDDNESGDTDEELGSGTDDECACLNGGVCKSNSCQCPFGWQGESCQTPICNNKCLNNGECIKPNTCQCKQGTHGNYCQFSSCDSKCENNGVCIGANKCQCKEGYTGIKCEKKICQSNCLNGGSCTSGGKCACPEGFTGNTCEIKRKCKNYVIKLVSYLRPATVYTFVTESLPCPDMKQKMCKTKRLKYRQVNKVDYRHDYICKT